jgi:hypothetical protein
MERLIQEAMIKEHKRIEKMLVKLETSFDSEKLNQLKWNIQKHFFIEENAVFSLYIPSSEGEMSAVDQILREHEEIMKMIELAEHNLNKEDIGRIISLLRSHAKFEDENFYPLLDEQLDALSKEKIIGRVSEIVRG